jgi:uncharacterized membrane protein YkvI
MSAQVSAKSSWFQRLLLPGLAFKAVVIGGGYATGRELAAFFLPSGPRGGLYGMALALAIWSAVCAVTFLFALKTGARDYRSFFGRLLGPAWPVFEIAYVLALIVILSVFSAAAGAIGQALFNAPTLAGELALMAGIAVFAAAGNDAVERLFKYVSFLLYGTYAVFLVLALIRFGPQIGAALAKPTPTDGWMLGGLTYAGYNLSGAVVILAVLRHATSRRDALVAGLLSGPLAMIPAILFFVAMTAFYPEIRSATLPSDFLLARLNAPVLRIGFQVMIFAALLESGTGNVHALNERISKAYQLGGRPALSHRARLLITIALLAGSVFIADKVGLVALIEHGYRLLSYVFLAVFVLPVMTVGLWHVLRGGPLEVVGDPDEAAKETAASVRAV